MCGGYAIEVVGLRKAFAGCLAVDDVSFCVGRGEVVAFLGLNGAGKSTTMRVLATFLSADFGTVRVGGYDVFYCAQEARRVLGYMPENNPLPLEMRVGEYLRFRFRLRRLRDVGRVDAVVAQCGLEGVEDRILGQLSKGYRQRVGLADALLHEPEVVILDEPTAGLDPNQIRAARQLIRSLAPRMTVLLSTHILPEAALTCDRAIILHRGRVLADESTAALQRRFLEYADVVAEIDAPIESAREVLARLPGVKEVRLSGRDGSLGRWVLRGDGGQDLRTEVFAAVRQNGWGLRELRREEVSLEDIFSRLISEVGSV